MSCSLRDLLLYSLALAFIAVAVMEGELHAISAKLFL